MKMAEMRTLENAYLAVEVSDAEAELSGVYDKKKEREVLWNADPTYWGRHAPIPFPFVGKPGGRWHKARHPDLPGRPARGHLVSGTEKCSVYLPGALAGPLR